MSELKTPMTLWRVKVVVEGGISGVKYDCQVPVFETVIADEDSKLALVEVSKQNFLVIDVE